MPFSPHHRPDDKTLREYLFASLPLDETERLDELSVVDDDFAARLDAVENELVDAYVQGELSGETLEKFRTQYMSSARRREKVKFAQSLHSFTGGTLPAGSGVVSAKPESDPLSPRSSSWWGLAAFPRWAFAGAMAMLLAISFLSVDNMRLRGRISQARADRELLQQREHDLQARLDGEQASDTNTANELAQVRQSLALLEQKSAPGRPVTLPLSVVAFVLSPQLRGAAQIADLSLPPGTTSVDLHLELESNEFPQYRVALKSLKTDQVLWHSGKLKAETKGQGSTLSIRVPANLLKQGSYLLELTGTPSTGDAEFVSSYVFRVGSS
jgi:hypothetical protein